MSASSIRRCLLHRGLRARVPLDRIPLTANHRQLRLQWAHEHRAWQADWHQVVFSDESRFNLSEHDDYVGERCLPDCVIERHSGANTRSYGSFVKFYSPKSFPSFKASLELSFSRIMHTHILQRLFRLLFRTTHATSSLPAYSLDMSPIEHVWDLVDRCLTRHPRPPASSLRIQAIWNSLPQAAIQNLFDSMPRRIAALIAARDVPSTDFGHLILFLCFEHFIISLC
ncbi:transposable element Tcb2 transposase [Trichonephila clavipes]|nr:transposable element Tcb2 transposase [Trichonephila clavipes]